MDMNQEKKPFDDVWNGFKNDENTVGEIISKRPEYEDLKKIAQDSGLPLKKISEMIR